MNGLAFLQQSLTDLDSAANVRKIELTTTKYSIETISKIHVQSWSGPIFFSFSSLIIVSFWMCRIFISMNNESEKRNARQAKLAAKKIIYRVRLKFIREPIMRAFAYSPLPCENHRHRSVRFFSYVYFRFALLLCFAEILFLFISF